MEPEVVKFLVPLVLLVLTYGTEGGPSNTDHDHSVERSDLPLSVDEALLTVHNQLPSGLKVSYVSDYCYKCLQQPLVITDDGNSNSSVVISTRHALTLFVSVENALVCSWTELYGEAGHYAVWVQQRREPNITCSVTVDKEPINSYIPILVAAIVMLSLTIIVLCWPYMYRWHYTQKCLNTMLRKSPGASQDCELAANSTTQADCTKPLPTRVKSLDAFRGLTLTILLFTNNGGGGYWFFQHAPWNGLTVADTVMPWEEGNTHFKAGNCRFVFMIGTSIIFTFHSMWKRGMSRLQMLRKIFNRSLKLILIGFCFLNYTPKDGLFSWSWARIPGVLQRLAVSYSVLSLLHMTCLRREIPLSEHHWWYPIQDLVLYWPEWVIIILMETLWLCLTFLLPVPGCPTGYLGPGGIGDNGLYPNCTGGAAGYIDRLLMGDHLYKNPTCKEMYHTTVPFDPEGVLSAINSVVMGFTGMQAGKIMLYFRKNHFSILKRFLIYAVMMGILAAILCKCSRDEGFIPVNKNLWSLSFITCTSCFAFIMMGLMYFIIDIKGWWEGKPFIYPGMNSIFVYAGQNILGFYLPFKWEPAKLSHGELLLQSLLNIILWVYIAYLLYRKRVFIKL
ncbi:heparan-alpha-glucosaminide N-acetyltransferase isoform X2 [Paramormyrops kingsleyae]|uniref:heparan-alpha-glucosaminide N-acetyltransferase isoform X2 n=1 Tax=Paramormyrops kingsleyae TaxID=1676925 RepID=UPI000CD626E6|nr:heparan-alpha-glucosaminide N-acetyltransferase-like isoform X2 [Paramormyrops kingsleyae]